MTCEAAKSASWMMVEGCMIDTVGGVFGFCVDLNKKLRLKVSRVLY